VYADESFHLRIAEGTARAAQRSAMVVRECVGAALARMAELEAS
jgi:hypothetical protein